MGAHSEADIAYCAGVIDSDGTIGIKRNTYKVRIVKDSTTPTYSIRICVRQVSREAVDFLSAQFGGSVRPAKTYAKRGRLLWSWEIRDKIAEAAIIELLPFLRIKRLQADNCLAMRKLIAESKAVRLAKGRGHMGSAHRPEALSMRMEATKLRANELNKVGT